MGAVKNEKNVLKLVHPGGYVEIHREPKLAAEILSKNPRHSITRPDVFKNPWVVIRPDSVLDTGGVFFIVPNHTIYHLLKAKTAKNQHQHQHPEQQQRCSRPPPPPGLIRVSPGKKHAKRDHHQCPKRSSFSAMSCIRPCSLELDYDSRVPCKKSHRETTNDHNRSVRRQECGGGGGSNERDHKQVDGLKSCLRKRDSARKLLRLKVSFGPPVVQDGDK